MVFTSELGTSCSHGRTGLGTARPATEESFLARECTTDEGPALLALRPTGDQGTAILTVAADGLEPVTLEVELRDTSTDVPGTTRIVETAGV
jgi:hypothetical protein